MEHKDGHVNNNETPTLNQRRCLRGMSTLISLRAPRGLVRAGTFCFCFRNHYSIPLSRMRGNCRPGLTRLGWADWSGPVFCADAALLIFSRNDYNMDVRAFIANGIDACNNNSSSRAVRHTSSKLHAYAIEGMLHIQRMNKTSRLACSERHWRHEYLLRVWITCIYADWQWNTRTQASVPPRPQIRRASYDWFVIRFDTTISDRPGAPYTCICCHPVP